MRCACADDKASVELELYVDKTTAPQLNSGKERLDDILVLHLQGGKDLFVSFSLGTQTQLAGLSHRNDNISFVKLDRTKAIELLACFFCIEVVI